MTATQDTQYQELVDTLTKAEVAYYAGSPIMSDAEYDAGLKSLVLLEENGTVDPASPSQRVGREVVKDQKKTEHAVPMLSLENAYTKEAFDKFIASVTSYGSDALLYIEPKLDGMSLSLIYENGILAKGITRGDGKVGEDITHNCKTIKSIPLKLQGNDIPERVEVRGEIYMAKSTFAQLNATLPENKKLANPRNAAVGAAKRSDSKKCAASRLSFLAYEIIEPDMIAHTHTYLMLAEFGFPKIPATLAKLTDKNLWEIILAADAARAAYDYETDGLVIKVSNHHVRKCLGAGTKYVKWASALKLGNVQAETTLEKIDIQVGKTGILAPVAILAPVNIGGTSITRATLSNSEEINRKGLFPGCRVVLQKAGMVIPEIVGLAKKQAIQPPTVPWVYPDKCPCCGKTAVRQVNADGSEAPFLVCRNTYKCKDQVAGRLEHWCKAVGIDGMGPVLANDLVACGIETPAKLYDTALLRQLAASTIGPGILSNLIKSIEASKDCGLEAALYGFCIPSIGEGGSKRLAKHFKSIHAIVAATLNELIAVEDIGEHTASDLVEWLNQGQSLTLIDNLETLGVHMNSKTYGVSAATGGGKLSGKTVVITGELESCTRDVAQSWVEQAGGKASGSVSKKTSYLVIGSAPGNNKVEAAKKHGTQILTESEFLALVNSGAQ